MRLIKKKELPCNDQISVEELAKIMSAYSHFISKSGGDQLKHRELKKNFDHFVRASLFVKRFDLTAERLIEIVQKKYSEINKKFVIPRPSQLYGDTVVGFIAEERGSQKTLNAPRLVQNAIKCAQTNRFKSFEEDEVLQKSRQKLKNKKFTIFDTTYIIERHVQIKGEPPAWIEKYEKMLSPEGV